MSELIFRSPTRHMLRDSKDYVNQTLMGGLPGFEPPIGLDRLDRIKALEQAERTFKLPKMIDVEKFFADYYGIIIGEADAVAKAMWPTHVFGVQV